MTSFKVHLHTMFATDLFEAFTHMLILGYHHVGPLLLAAGTAFGVVQLLGLSGFASYFGPI